jgi:hypothetical protein
MAETKIPTEWESLSEAAGGGREEKNDEPIRNAEIRGLVFV